MKGLDSIKKALKNNTMIFILIAVAIFFEALIQIGGKGSLLSPSNVTNIINQNAYVVILATGMLLCILTGGNIDLSVGSIVCLVGAVAGTFIINMGWPVLPTILLCLIVGLLVGAWHGFWIAFVHIPPFICTLSGMLLWRGVSLLILNGMTISPFPAKYMNIFSSYLPDLFLQQVTDDMPDDLFFSILEKNQKITFTVTLIVALVVCAIILTAGIIGRASKRRKGYAVPSAISFIIKQVILCGIIVALGVLLGLDKGIPIVLVFVAIIVLAYAYFTQNTVPGRYLYAIGGNAKAAKLSGINTDKVMFFAYTNMGFLSGVAALVVAARLNSAAPTAGQNYEMDAIASCFIGGASAYGGTGTIGGAVIGAVFMGILNNGMSILGVDMNWQRTVKGLVLLLAVIFDVVSKKRKSSK
ncbi:MAG: sugar ABC transporter permease [Treponema sp.]|nr:sugar ABC transporter permease [Treponema sp.]